MRAGLFRCGLVVVSLAVPAPAFAGGDQRLIDAARNRDEGSVRALLHQHVDPNAIAPDGTTALHWAVHRDVDVIADLLIHAGAEVNAADDEGVTPIALASINGNATMIKRLLAAGADANATLPTGETALMTAARTGKLDAVDALLAHGADPNRVEPTKGQTALMWAAADAHTSAVRSLVAHGADVRKRSKSGFTPLLFAARQSDRETTRILLEAGADVNEASSDGLTPLLIATIRGQIDYAEFLLRAGANPNAGEFTPLQRAAGMWDNDLTTVVAEDSEWYALGGLHGEDKLRFVKMLLEYGADPNAPIAVNPSRYGAGGGPSVVGATPFVLAAMGADIEVMRVLLTAGANPLAAAKDGTTALMMAAGLGIQWGRPSDTAAISAMQLCLDLGVDVNAVTTANETALHAAAHGRDPIVQFLYEHHANLNVKNRLGWTPLTIAEGVFNGSVIQHFPSTEKLLQTLGAEPSAPDVNRMNLGR
jgi:ankyrin repeat protein